MGKIVNESWLQRQRKIFEQSRLIRGTKQRCFSKGNLFFGNILENNNNTAITVGGYGHNPNKHSDSNTFFSNIVSNDNNKQQVRTKNDNIKIKRKRGIIKLRKKANTNKRKNETIEMRKAK